jgi:hypothetical protein
MIEDGRVEVLKAKHAELDRQIHDEEKRPSPDHALVHELKRRKLQIKDEMQRSAVH